MPWYKIYQIPFQSQPYEFHLHGLCDLQIGNETTSLSTINHRINKILADPCDSGIIIPGDIEDEDRPSTRRIRRSAFADRSEVWYRDAQKHMAWLDKEVIPLLLPLQKTKYGIMGIIAGHHWTQLSNVLNSVEYMCMELTRLSKKEVPYLGQMSSYMDLRFQTPSGSLQKMIHVEHGQGGGTTEASTVNKLLRTAKGSDADAFIRAHDCQVIAWKSPRMSPKRLKDPSQQPDMLSRTIPFLNLGSATRGYVMSRGEPSYVENAGLSPKTMGWGTMKFEIRKAFADEDSHRNLKCDIWIEI